MPTIQSFTWVELPHIFSSLLRPFHAYWRKVYVIFHTVLQFHNFTPGILLFLFLLVSSLYVTFPSVYILLYQYLHLMFYTMHTYTVYFMQAFTAGFSIAKVIIIRRGVRPWSTIVVIANVSAPPSKAIINV